MYPGSALKPWGGIFGLGGYTSCGYFHLAYPTNKGSGWADPAFYHVESAEKEDNCAPRGKHASAPHRPALPLPAIRLASASHTRSSFRPPLARSMHTSPNSARKRP
jgi:hypothetical protein